MNSPTRRNTGLPIKPNALPVELSGFRKHATDMSQTDFSARFAGPFLVFARTRSLVEAITAAHTRAFEDGSTAISTIEMVESPLAFICPLTGDRPLKGGAVVTLGRNPDNDLVLPVASVSGEHLQFMAPVRDEDAWLVRDLGSKNGTFVDGARMIPGQPYELRDGAQIEVGRDVSGTFWGVSELWGLLKDPSRLSELLKKRKVKPADEW